MSVQEKSSWFTFDINVPAVVGFSVALYFMYAGHTATMENARKTSALLTKYETLLDSAIERDPDVLSTYKGNLKRVEDSLSPEEKRLLTLLLDVKVD